MDANDVVLVCEKNGDMSPFYRGALQCAQGWPTSIRRRYVGAVVIDEDGRVDEIEGVGKFRLFGQSRAAKLFSFFNNNWSLELSLRPVHFPLGRIKEMTIRGLEADAFSKRQLFELPHGGDFAAKIHDSKSIKEIFDYLALNRESLSIDDDDSAAALDCL